MMSTKRVALAQHLVLFSKAGFFVIVLLPISIITIGLTGEVLAGAVLRAHIAGVRVDKV